MTKSSSPVSSVQVLEKAVRVLDCFTPDRPTRTVGEIRNLMGLPATTVNRLVTTLVANDVLQHDGKAYRIGLRAIAWSAAATAGSEVITAAGPVLTEVRDRSGETTGLYVRRGSTRVLVAAELSHQSVIYSAQVGQVMPMHAGSPGRVFLAHDARAFAATIDDQDPAVQAAVANRVKLEEDLHRVRRDGYAFTAEERERGLSSVSAPVFDRLGHLVAVLAVGAPSFRLDTGTASALGNLLRESAAALSRRLGFVAAQSAPAAHDASDEEVG